MIRTGMPFKIIPAYSKPLVRLFCLVIGALDPTHIYGSQTLIGYGSSDSVLPAKTQEIFYLGFEVGFSLATNMPDISSTIISDNAWDGSPLGASKSARRLIERGVIAVAGFPISQDALLASQEILKTKVMGIFAAARHSDLSNFGPQIVSTVPSMQSDIASMLEFIKNKKKNFSLLIVTNPYNVFCKNQEDLIIDTIKNNPHFAQIPVTSVSLSKDFKLNDEDLKKIKSGKWNYLWMTPYPDMSISVLRQFEEQGIDLPILANASWTTDDFELIRRLLIKRRSPVFSTSLWIHGSKEGKVFEREFKKRFGREPSTEAAYGFDLGNIVGQTLRSAKQPVNSAHFMDAFYKIGCFQKNTTGTICFRSSGGHADRALSFVQFENGVFKLVGKSKPVLK